MIKLVLISAIMIIAVSNIGNIYAKTSYEKSYSIGYSNGCASVETTGYVKDGGSQHSKGYLDGFHDGSNICNDSGQNSNNDNQNQNNRNQPQGESNNQHVFCVNVFGSCPVTNGQSQGLTN